MVEIHDKIKRSLQAAESLYHRLVLLVGKSGSGKTGVLREVAEDQDTPLININLELSRRLIELTARQRALQLPKILNQIMNEAQPLVALDNLEILFDQTLKQNPLHLLQGISRNRTVLASWNGAYDGRKIVYAEIGHPEYRSYDSGDLLIVSMDGADPVKNNTRVWQA